MVIKKYKNQKKKLNDKCRKIRYIHIYNILFTMLYVNHFKLFFKIKKKMLWNLKKNILFKKICFQIFNHFIIDLIDMDFLFIWKK